MPQGNSGCGYMPAVAYTQGLCGAGRPRPWCIPKATTAHSAMTRQRAREVPVWLWILLAWFIISIPAGIILGRFPAEDVDPDWPPQ